MSAREKVVLLEKLLESHKHVFERVIEPDMMDYTECIQLFLRSSDPIIQEGSLATCQLIIQRAKESTP